MQGMEDRKPRSLNPIYELFGSPKKYRVITVRELIYCVQDFIEREVELPVGVNADIVDWLGSGRAHILLDVRVPQGLIPGLMHVIGMWLIRVAKEADEYYGRKTT